MLASFVLGQLWAEQEKVYFFPKRPSRSAKGSDGLRCSNLGVEVMRDKAPLNLFSCLLAPESNLHGPDPGLEGGTEFVKHLKDGMW